MNDLSDSHTKAAHVDKMSARWRRRAPHFDRKEMDEMMSEDIKDVISKYPGLDMQGFSGRVMHLVNILVAKGDVHVREDDDGAELYYVPEPDTIVGTHDDGAVCIRYKEVWTRLPAPTEHIIIDVAGDSYVLMKSSEVEQTRAHNIDDAMDTINKQSRRIDELIDERISLIKKRAATDAMHETLRQLWLRAERWKATRGTSCFYDYIAMNDVLMCLSAAKDENVFTDSFRG